MKKIALTSLSLLCAAGLAYANTPCNGFEIKIKNNTPDDLVVSKTQLTGAELRPGGLETIPGHSEQVFTVNNSADDGQMKGVMEFKSVSMPVRNAAINFELRNKSLVCHHENESTSGDYLITYSREVGKIKYTIG